MANKYLGREDAPISAAVWEKLDATVIEVAKSQLVGRRLLHIEGPYGLGLKFVPLDDMLISAEWEEAPESTEGAEEKEEDTLFEDLSLGPEIVASPVIPVALIRHAFVLGARDLAAYERDGVGLDLSGVAEAAVACARAEDQLIFKGSVDLETSGLLNAEGNHSFKLSAWEKVGRAADDIIKAVTLLDGSGFHGPYSLALAPSRYNLLFRLYPQSSTTELAHLQSIVTAGIFKASILKEGGVLLASGRQFASIVIGQDMSVGFIGPSDGELEFSISESLALRVRQPKAICALEG
jgi:uncharacterized linocin/CFP29 family protein